MKYITPSIFFALAVIACVLAFYVRYARAAAGRCRPDGFFPAAAHPGRAFAGTCYPMERADRLPVLLITFLYALTAFFQLGDTRAPQTKLDLADGRGVTVQVEGESLYATGIRTYSALGTGAYNVEISSDGVHWSTLWQRHDDASDRNKVTGYYWADAAGYRPDYALTQSYSQLFKWNDITIENPQFIQYIRITGRADKDVLQLSKFYFLGQDGNALPFSLVRDGPFAPKTDVRDLFTVDWMGSGKSTWHNSAYFDEIYHARTALEHIEGIYPYEITHPPLGKLILGLGIRLFGMTPFGWRFMGTLFGVVMLPVLYLFLKNLFGRTAVAACGTTLFAADFMHLTQTRIATIDTYAVFFILCMYFFLYRYLTLPAGASFRRGALPLFLSGLAWGLGAASKWTVFYAGIGLAVVYFIGFFQKLRDWPEERRAARGRWCAATLLFSLVCFVLLPFLIYILSYLPYALAEGVDLSPANCLRGLKESFPILFDNVLGKLSWQGPGKFEGTYVPADSLTGIVANNQWYMLNYHSGVNQAHPYSAWWFEWILDARPILYYMDNSVPGYTTRFAAFSNPVVCWAGLLAILTCFARSFRRLGSKLAFLWGFGLFAAWITWKTQHVENGVFDPALTPEDLRRNVLILAAGVLVYLLSCVPIALYARGQTTGRDVFLTVAFLSQLTPWFFIGRTTFAYHYFPSILFLSVALASVFHCLTQCDPNWKKPVYGLTGLAVGLYALFYPVLIGIQIPVWYEPLVKWIESWPF